MCISEAAYRSLYNELREYEDAGIAMIMNGNRVSSMEIVKAYMARETGDYMRDYIINPKGEIEALVFDQV
ncbi:MAG: hypothetical protein FWE25_06860 [Lachnospiraceae bacterium]|nr:hypothetical protein [Lachnospiraceae bacterium]